MQVKILQDQKIQAGAPDRQAHEEAVIEATVSVPYGYDHLIDRSHIPNNPNNADGTKNKVRTLWEAMENFRTLGAPSVPKEIEPMKILPHQEGTHGRLLLMPGHEVKPHLTL